MTNAVQLNMIPAAKLTQESSGKPKEKEAQETGLDFAALLMGLMQPQTQPPNPLNLPSEEIQLPDLPVNLAALPVEVNGEGLVDLPENMATLTPTLTGLHQALDVVEDEQPVLNQLLSEGVKSFEKALENGLTESQEAESKNLEGLNFHLKDHSDFITGEFSTADNETAFKLKEANLKAEDVAVKENLETDPLEASEAKEMAKEPLKLKENYAEDLTVKQDQSLQTGSFSSEFREVKSGEVLPKEVTLPKQLKSVFEQLVNESKLTVSQGKSEVEIKLKPEYLGKVHLKIALEKGVLTAKLAVENLMVSKALESNLNQLKNQLQEQGLNFEQVHVEVGNGALDQNPKEPFYKNQQFKSFNPKTDLSGPSEEGNAPVLGSGVVDYLA